MNCGRNYPAKKFGCPAKIGLWAGALVAAVDLLV